MEELLKNDFWKEKVKKKKFFYKIFWVGPFSRVGRETGDKNISFFQPKYVKWWDVQNANVPIAFLFADVLWGIFTYEILAKEITKESAQRNP